MTTTTTEKKITITLSERAPIRIDPATWTEVASAFRHDGKVFCEANNVWGIAVREHADGRRVVYGSHTAGGGGQYRGFRPTYAGYLVPPGEAFRDCGDGPLGHVPDEEATIRAIRRVAGVIGDDQLGAECIADLPAEEID